jgi:cation transport regulator
MPYTSVRELPPAVRDLPAHAQEIFMSAFNNAWATYAAGGLQQQEATAFRIAWAAVKKRYRKRGNRWLAKEGPD